MQCSSSILASSTHKLKASLKTVRVLFPSELASIHQALWRLGESAESREQAIALYEALYAHTPNIEYRDRLRELRGVSPPPPLALPPLPAIMAQPLTPLDSLLEQVDAYLVQTAGS